MNRKSDGLSVVLRSAIAAAMLARAAVAAAEPPAQVTIEYQMSRNGVVMAEVKETLRHGGKSYRIVSEARGVGVFALAARGHVLRTSAGTIGAHGLRPDEFRDQRGDDVAVAKFDWKAMTVTEEHRGERRVRPIAAGAQDRLSFLWNSAFSAPRASGLDALVADGRGATEFRYTLAGIDSLDTPAGGIEALHFVKRLENGDRRGTEIWLARRGYLPLRILVVEPDGTRVDQVVSRIAE